MNILVAGGGGREHALAWRLARGGSVKKVFAAPGNPGTARLGENIPCSGSPESILAAAQHACADLTIIGPEAPLSAGVVDLFQSRGLRVFGPTAAAARLESSKIFSKQFMERAGLPTARFTAVDNEADARKALDRFGLPVVLKADGLAAGKGVVIARDRATAENAIASLGSRLVIEEFLEGEEVSFIALSDGRHVLPLEPTQDHKTVFDGDQGPNTGGMGAYCDSRILSAAETRRIMDTIVLPVIDRMDVEGSPFTGFLYAGLMMTAGSPKLLEFNVRMGDPETQPLMQRLDCDFAQVIDAASRGELDRCSLTWREEPSVCVVAAAHGYPGKVRTGDVITGIAEAEAAGATVFHAGTRQCSDGTETSGGRVLGVTASSANLPEAITRAYSALSHIHFAGMHYRRDIGGKGLKRWR